MIKLEHLKVFVVVAEAGELLQAGAKLGRTPAALSMTLKQLEEELGGSLFESERKGHLTPLGSFVLNQARPLVGMCANAISEMKHFAMGRSGIVQVAAVPSAAALLLPRALQRLRSSRPDVRVQLRDIDSKAVVKAVLEENVDVGIATVVGNASDLVVTPLLIDPFVWVCPPGHPLTKLRRNVRWEDIDPDDFIANGLCAGLGVTQLDALVQRASLMLLSTTSLLGFVRASMGVTLLPALAVPKDGTLVTLNCQSKRYVRHLHLISRAGMTLVPAATALIEAVKAEARNRGYAFYDRGTNRGTI